MLQVDGLFSGSVLKHIPFYMSTNYKRFYYYLLLYYILLCCQDKDLKFIGPCCCCYVCPSTTITTSIQPTLITDALLEILKKGNCAVKNLYWCGKSPIDDLLSIFNILFGWQVPQNEWKWVPKKYVCVKYEFTATAQVLFGLFFLRWLPALRA